MLLPGKWRRSRGTLTILDELERDVVAYLQRIQLVCRTIHETCPRRTKIYIAGQKQNRDIAD